MGQTKSCGCNPFHDPDSRTNNGDKYQNITKYNEEKEEEYVIGLDSSTQSLTISIYTTHSFNEIDSVNINYDQLFGDKYGIEYGAISQGLQVTAPTALFIDALDVALHTLASNKKVNFNKIIAVSGSGQMHGSVYWNNKKSLNNLDPNRSLLNNLCPTSFAIECGPIWMDSSTTKQCRELEQKVGSALELAHISGSIAYERFTGNQIAKIYQLSPNIYSEKVERISLISSFMASLFIGDYAQIDCSDGSGMNLLDINTQEWSTKLAELTAPNLIAKLGRHACNSYDVIGKIDKYFVNKYAFNAECDVVAFSGDNCCSLAGLMCYEEGDICVSLGTSTNLFAVTKTAKPTSFGHVLCSPIHEKSFMILLCYKNGSITREKIKNEYNCKTWDEFNKKLLESEAGNGGCLGFYYDKAEILPPIKPDFYRYDANDNKIEEYKDDDNGLKDIRGVVESQFLAMRQHCEEIGVVNSKKILATGGASKNKAILQILSDVFGAAVYLSESGPETATKGAALRALHGYQCGMANKFIPFSDVIKNIEDGNKYIKVAEPILKNTQMYTKLLPRRKALEDTLPRL